jgi:hypothetical protein
MSSKRKAFGFFYLTPIVLLGYPTALDAILARAGAETLQSVATASKGDPKQVMEELARRNLITPVTTQGHIGDVLPDNGEPMLFCIVARTGVFHRHKRIAKPRPLAQRRFDTSVRRDARQDNRVYAAAPQLFL